jgi:hypothetical protein
LFLYFYFRLVFNLYLFHYFNFRLEFNNPMYDDYVRAVIVRTESSMPFKAYALFQVFPFAILFDEQLKIRLVGTSLRLIVPFVVGTKYAYYKPYDNPDRQRCPRG